MKTNSDILVSKHHQTNSSLNYSAITTEGKQKKKKRNINSYKDIYLQKQSSSPNQSLQFKTHTANLTLNSQNDNSDSKGHNKSFRVNSQQNKRQDLHNLSIPNYSRSNTATPNMMKKGRKDNKNESDDLLGEEISKVNNAKDLFVNKGRKGNIKKGFRESRVKEFKIGEDISEIKSDSYKKDTLEVEKEKKDKDKDKVKVKGDLNGNDNDAKKKERIKMEVMKKEKVDSNLKGMNDGEYIKNDKNVNSKDNKSDNKNIKDDNRNIKNDNTELKTKNNIDKHNNINNNNTNNNKELINSTKSGTNQQIQSDKTLINKNNNTSLINKNTKEQPKENTKHNNNYNNSTEEQSNLHSPFIKSNSNIPTITEEPNSKNESYEEISLYEETETENIDSKGNKTKLKQLIKTKKQIPKSQINSILQQQSILKQKHSNIFTTPPHNEPTTKPEITSTTLSNTLSPLTTQQLKQNSNIKETSSNPTSSLHQYEYEQKQIPIYDNNGNIIGYTIKKYRKRKQSNNNDIEIIEEIEEGSNGEVKVIYVIQRIKTTKKDSNGNIIEEYKYKDNIIKSSEYDNNNSNISNNIQKEISSSPTQTHIKHRKRTFHNKTPSESQILYKSPNIHLQYTPSLIKPSASARLYSPIQQYKIVHENEISTYSQPKIKSPLILSIIQNHFSINTTNNTSNTNNKHHQRALTEGNIIPNKDKNSNISKHTSPKQNDKSSSSTTTTQIHNLINDIHSKTNSNNKESSSYLEQLSKQHKSELKQLQTKRDNIKKEKRQRNEYKRTYHHNKNISCISIGTNNSLEKRLPQLLNDNIYQKELITSINNTSINDMKLYSNQYHYKLTAPSRCAKGDNLFQHRSQQLNKRKEGYANIATLRYNNKFLTERKKVSFCNESKDRFPNISNNNNEYKTPFLSKLKADNLKYEIEKHIKLSCRNNPYEISKQTTHQRNVFSQEHIEPKSSFKNSYGIMPINSMNELYEMQYHYYFFKK